MWWRKNLHDGRERLAEFVGVAEETPVAVFRQMNGNSVPLSMSDLGELAALHRQLSRAEIPARCREWIPTEQRLACTGALALHIHHDIEIDPRLDPPPQITQAVIQTPVARSVFKGLMQRLTSKAPGHG